MIDTIIFDLGGVLIDWNPRYLYQKIFKTDEEVTWFLTNVCTPEWNEQQDAGRSFAEATEEAVIKFPEHEHAILAWTNRWEETIKGPIKETVQVLSAIRAGKQQRLYALTNWSAETFPLALRRFDFLQWFEGIVVSGVEKTRKPYSEIYRILLNRYSVDPAKALFIDDNQINVEAARLLGIDAIHFTGAQGLVDELVSRGLNYSS